MHIILHSMLKKKSLYILYVFKDRYFWWYLVFYI